MDLKQPLSNQIPSSNPKQDSESSDDKAFGSSEKRRRELADFLRTRREKLKPEQVGIAHGSRRRTPGLRREEVAELAGVGTTWYTWLEQARDIQPSSEVLRRLAQALQMGPAEVRHMFSLAGKSPPVDMDPSSEVVSPSLQRFLENGLQVPALLLGQRWDVIGANRKGREIFDAIFELPPEKRNWMYFIFCADITRENLDNWEANARRLIAEFRASLSDSLDNPWVIELVELLKAESSEFGHWWKEHDVRENAATTVRFVHPHFGNQVCERMILGTPENPKFKIITFTPVQEKALEGFKESIHAV